MVMKAGKKRNLAPQPEAQLAVEEVPLTRGSEDEPPRKVAKWTNKTRVLVLAARGISFRGRHLMEDIFRMMPHAKSDSKMQKRESLFAVNEIAEMKNCSRCLMVEGRRKKDVYLWASIVARGPSVKFEVENIHTMAELKMTGNCLAASRPLLSFSEDFSAKGDMHLQIIKELLTSMFGVPNHHPKSQPFFDHVFTFSIVDNKIWFRNYQILEESGSLAEVGPRMVLNPIRIFEGSFCGQTLWENSTYVTPTAKRSMLKRAKAGKYQEKLQSKALYEASRPTEPTYKVDETEDVFATIETETEDTVKPRKMLKPKKKKKKTAVV
jgi:ribosome biogenesis protein BRX1